MQPKCYTPQQVVSHVRFDGDSISSRDLRVLFDACVETIGDAIRILREVWL